MNELPDKASELIRLALADLRKSEENPNHVINMMEWHAPFPCERCMVCLAGAVMANTLKIPDNVSASPSNGSFSTDTCKKLIALNAFRVGNIHDGLYAMGYFENHEIYNFPVLGYYSHDADRFHEKMEEMAAYLEAKGL